MEEPVSESIDHNGRMDGGQRSLDTAAIQDELSAETAAASVLPGTHILLTDAPPIIDEPTCLARLHRSTELEFFSLAF